MRDGVKKAGALLAFTILLIIVVPGVITLVSGTDAEYDISEPFARVPEGVSDDTEQTEPEEGIAVFNPGVTESTQENTSGGIGLEEYVAGVVAAEMPPEYEEEALKAQAVAARTYAYKRLEGDGETVTQDDIESIYQAYRSVSELKDIWGESFEENYAKILGAVAETQGEIMVYDDEPIEAVFHSSSAGMTEDAENVWNKEYPYLKSVPSGEEQTISEKAFTNEELKRLFSDSFDGLSLTDSGFLTQFEIVSRTEAGYVLLAQAGNLTLTGNQIRDTLGLKSSAFTVREEGGEIVFTSTGWGHGVGMSQNGANQMARNGSDYREILSYYYNGVSIISIK